MKEETRSRIALIAGLIAAGALIRLLPHPPNFHPVTAIALFAGARLGRRFIAFAVPIAAMLASDTILEMITGWGFHSGMAVVYGTFALIVGLGILVGRRGSGVGSVAAGAVGGATLFYLTTNFAVWMAGGMYPLTLEGLVSCFVAAIPFYGNAIAGDLFYSAALFGTFAIAERRVELFAPAPVEVS